MWVHKILHPKSVSDKLGIKLSLTISAVCVPDDATMSDAQKPTAKFVDGEPASGAEMIFLATTTTSDLSAIRKLLAPPALDGTLRVVFPEARQEITELQVLEAGRAAGLYDVKVVSYSPAHIAVKFVRPQRQAPGT